MYSTGRPRAHHTGALGTACCAAGLACPDALTLALGATALGPLDGRANKKTDIFLFLFGFPDLEGTEEFQWSSAIRVDRIEERPVHMLDGTWSTSMDLGNSCQNRFTIIC